MKQKFFVVVSALAFALVLIGFGTRPFTYTLSVVKVDGTVKTKLEQLQAILQTKGKTSATSSTYSMAGAKSTVRLKISEAIFQSSSDQATLRINPADYIELYKVTLGKNNRSITINTDGSSNPSKINIVFTALDYGFYRIGPANGLIAGEYAFIDKSTLTTDGKVNVWTFGID